MRTFCIYIYIYFEKLGKMTGNKLLSYLYLLAIFSFIFIELWQTELENGVLLSSHSFNSFISISRVFTTEFGKGSIQNYIQYLVVIQWQGMWGLKKGSIRKHGLVAGAHLLQIFFFFCTRYLYSFKKNPQKKYKTLRKL